MKTFFAEKGLVTPTKLFRETDVIFAEKLYSTEESVLEEFEGQPKFRDHHFRIDYTDINEIIPHPNFDNPSIQINLKKGLEYATFYFDFTAHNEYTDVLNYLVAKTKLQAVTQKAKGSLAWTKNLLYTMFAGIFGGLIYNAAKAHEAGEIIDVSGRRSGIKRLLVSIGESLGSTLSLVLWVVLVLVFLYLTYNAYKKSSVMQTVYK